jgi:hypothetical protein
MVCALILVSCRPQTITADDAASSIVDSSTITDSAAPDVADVTPIVDANDPDACVPGDTWDARVERTYGPSQYMPNVRVNRTLDLVLLHDKRRKTIYPICDQTGGGCGDCSVPGKADPVKCTLKPDSANVEIGTDDFSTSVLVVQRGQSIVAEWTTGEMSGAAPPSHRTEVLMKLPCAVKIRFVR